MEWQKQQNWNYRFLERLGGRVPIRVKETCL